MIDLKIRSYRLDNVDDKPTFNTKLNSSEFEIPCSFPSNKENVHAPILRVQNKKQDQMTTFQKTIKDVNVGTPTKSSNGGIESDDHSTSIVRYNILTGNKKGIVNILRSSNFLNNIDLKPVSSRKIRAAEKEISFDRIKINGVQFFSGPKSHKGLRLLRDICTSICMPEVQEETYEKVVLRLSRNVASMDCIKAPKNVDLHSLTLIKYAESPMTPIEVDIFVACDCVHANICIPVTYGLYRQNDMKEIERQKKLYTTTNQSVHPWIVVAARVEEKINLTTGVQIRSLKSTIS